jgi:transposase
MNSTNYIGLDIHKKSISCCVRQADGTIIQENTIAATRHALDEWMRQLPQPWIAGMEATLFTGWIYDHLVSGGAMVKVAHPAMLQAIAAGKNMLALDRSSMASEPGKYTIVWNGDWTSWAGTDTR